MKALVVGIAGLGTAALLFPTHSVTGCNGDCETRNISVLVEYPGENGAIGMGIALVLGFLVAVCVFYALRSSRRLRKVPRSLNDGSTTASDRLDDREKKRGAGL